MQAENKIVAANGQRRVAAGETYTGKFYAFSIIEDAEITALEDKDGSQLARENISGVTLPAGQLPIFAPVKQYTTITVGNNGSIWIYKS